MRTSRARYIGPSKQAIADACRGREHELLIAAGIPADILDGQGWPCPFPDCPGGPGQDRFRFDSDSGVCWCRQCLATKGGRIDLPDCLGRLWGVTFPAALEAIESYMHCGNWNSPVSGVCPVPPAPPRPTVPNTLGQAALFFAGLGCEIFPLAPGTKRPLAGSHGHLDATADLEIVADWWQRHPNCNIALSTQHWVVLDIDLHKPACGCWWQTRPKLQALLWQSAEVVQRSSRGGLHFFFRMPPERQYKSLTNADGIPGFDIKATGGYLLLAPSCSRDIPGASYQFFVQRELVEPVSRQPYPPAPLRQAIDSLWWPGSFTTLLNSIESQN